MNKAVQVMICHMHTAIFAIMADIVCFLAIINYSRLVVYKPEAEKLSTDITSRLYKALAASFAFTLIYNITDSMYASITRFPI